MYYANSSHIDFPLRLCIYRGAVARIEVDTDKTQRVNDTSMEWLMSICKWGERGGKDPFAHDRREKNGQVLHRNLKRVKSWLTEAVTKRLRVWNAKQGNGGHRVERRHSRARCVCRVLWVGHESVDESGEHDLGPIAADLEEEKQRFPPSCVKTLEAYKELHWSASVRMSSQHAFRDRGDWNGRRDNEECRCRMSAM